MNKFKMELTWHNCLTHPPKEDYNPWLIYTNGHNIFDCAYCKEDGFPIKEERLHEFWWADLLQTIRETKEFKEEV